MSISHHTIRIYFQKLGLAPEIADIYLALYKHGPQTISQLSRHSEVERTRIYRLVDELEKSNLVETELQYKRRIFHAAPISNLQIHISKKEQELEQLQAELDTIDHALTQAHLSSPTTRVQFYQGVDGAKQMFWNQTKAHTEVLSILHETMQHQVKMSFFQRWVGAMNSHDVRHRMIVSDSFIESINNWYSKHQNERTKHLQMRYISSEKFAIAHATAIYNDTIQHYDGRDKNMFGIEIHNPQIAHTQRQFFEMLWQQTSSLKK